ncbi:MAG: hypothetical protein HXS44_06595 [Theionarchaea archaeon]|nr:hypothetical protein [Theionarchaea archaeon]
MMNNPEKRSAHLLKGFRAFPGLSRTLSFARDEHAVQRFLEKVTRDLHSILCPYKRTLTRISKKDQKSQITIRKRIEDNFEEVVKISVEVMEDSIILVLLREKEW